MDERFIRQQELVNQEKLSELSVTIIGCGAVGSFTAVSLAKMGIRQLVLNDPDKVSIENLPNQFFREEDLGKTKVLALADIIKSFDSAASIMAIERPHIRQKLVTDIVISSVDNMAARQNIFESALKSQVKLLIDPRMAAHVMQVYSVNPYDPISRQTYEATLITDTEAIPERCTARSIIYAVLPLAALICRQVALYANGEWVEPALTFDMKTLTLLREGVTVK